MTLIRGCRTVPIERAAADVIEKALALISERIGRSVTEDEVLVRQAYLCNDQPDRYDTQFTLKGLRQVAKEVDDLPGMRNHNTWNSDDLPVMRWLPGRVTDLRMVGLDGKEVDAKAALCPFYMPRAGDVHGLIPRIETGVLREVSFSWYSAPFMCSICGDSLSTCKHTMGSVYEGKKCLGLMEVEEGVEASLVWKGGQVGTKIVTPRGDEAVALEDVVRRMQSKSDPLAGRGRESTDQIAWAPDSGPDAPVKWGVVN